MNNSMGLSERHALEKKVLETVDGLKGEIAETNRYLYEHPELSNKEHESSRYLTERARQHGFEVEMGVAGLATAFRAFPAAVNPGPRVAFLAEYDALPGVGHGCGHNMIGTAGVYAAIGLASVAEDLPGSVGLFGTPAEETDGGKIHMLHAGVFEGVTAALMAHPGLDTEIAYSSLACTCVVVEFVGKSAHAAASPWKGINALDAMIQLFVSVDQLRKQLPLTARLPGVILNGGERANMVPDYTKAEFSIRGIDRAEAEYVRKRVLDCAQGAATATGAQMKWQEDGPAYYEMRPDPKLAEVYRQAWLDVGGERPTDSGSKPHGSLDIGNLSHVFPCLHPSFQITRDPSIAGHSAEFARATITSYAEEQLVYAIKALSLTGLRVLISR